MVRVQNLLKTFKRNLNFSFSFILFGFLNLETRSLIDLVIKFLDKNIPVIAPDRTLRLIWDYFIVFFMIMNFFYIPLEISFDFYLSPEKNWLLYVLIKIIPVWIFFINVIFNFLTAYYSKGVYIYNKQRIILRYLRKEFVMDLITLVPFAFSIYFQYKYGLTFFIIHGSNASSFQ